MTLEEVINEMESNDRYTGPLENERPPCPQCGGVLKFEQVGHWKRVPTATCRGHEAGWLRYENPCGFQVKGAADLARMETALDANHLRAKRDLGDIRARRAAEQSSDFTPGFDTPAGD